MLQHWLTIHWHTHSCTQNVVPYHRREPVTRRICCIHLMMDGCASYSCILGILLHFNFSHWYVYWLRNYYTNTINGCVRAALLCILWNLLFIFIIKIKNYTFFFFLAVSLSLYDRKKSCYWYLVKWSLNNPFSVCQRWVEAMGKKPDDAYFYLFILFPVAREVCSGG